VHAANALSIRTSRTIKYKRVFETGKYFAGTFVARIDAPLNPESFCMLTPDIFYSCASSAPLFYSI
jgi:hypothetical protein